MTYLEDIRDDDGRQKFRWKQVVQRYEVLRKNVNGS